MGSPLYSRTFISAAMAATLLSACATPPTKTYLDGKWNVAENLCASNPEQEDLNDMRSVIKRYSEHDMANNIEMSMYHLDKTIFDLSLRFTRSGGSGTFTSYENSSSNKQIKVSQVKSLNKLSTWADEAMDDFFAKDSKINANEAHSSCLYRGL